MTYTILQWIFGTLLIVQGLIALVVVIISLIDGEGEPEDDTMCNNLWSKYDK